MTTYKVLLNAENLLVSVDGREGKGGLYVTRIVQASSETEAAATAISRLVESEHWKSVRSINSGEDPFAFAEEMEVIAETELGEHFDTGFIFYLDE